MQSAMVALQQGVVLANQSPKPRPRMIRSVAAQQCSKIRALQARPGQYPASKAICRPRFEFSLHAQTQALGRVTMEMPVNCFGEVVDDAMLEEFNMDKTQENRAKLALRFININDKKGQASRFVANLKDMYGIGSSTLCLLYNATGDTISYSANHDWYDGSLYRHGYPEEIGNGQWAAFLHVHKQGAPTGSFGSVVYRGKKTHGKDKYLLVAWHNPWFLVSTNKAYCEIGAAHDFYDGRWDEIYTALENSGYTSTSTADGLQIHAETDRGTSPTITAVISQQ